MRRNILTFIVIGVFGTLSVIALGSETLCFEPIHSKPEVITFEWKSNPQETLENKVKLHGQVNPNNTPTTAWFEYGESESMNNNTGYIYLSNKEKTTEVNIATKEIKPNKKYFYRLVSENEYGVSYGKTETLQNF